MRIQRKAASRDHASRLQVDIDQAASGVIPSGRICDGCATVCATCGSTGCQCQCSPDCADAPALLSGDPEGFPIEPGIVGLVFAMTRSGLFTPCWSCEGHLSADGALWKTPGVWFYCDATVHVRLLSDGVDNLANTRRLNTRWSVGITFSDPDNPRTTFALQPVLSPEQPVTLAQLQADASAIAAALPDILVLQGRALQRAARPALAYALAADPA